MKFTQLFKKQYLIMPWIAFPVKLNVSSSFIPALNTPIGIGIMVHLTGKGHYPFNLDLVATAPQEPQGAVRQWLVWLQDYLGIHPPASAMPEATATERPITLSPTSGGSPSTSTPPPTRTPSASQTTD